VNKLVEIFCDVDDFCQVFIPQWEKQLLIDGTRQRNRACRMSMSEIMTIIIAFHTSNHRDFKNYYKGYISQFYQSHFPTLLSYTRFLEVMPNAIVPLSSYFSTLKGEATGIEFIDSTSIKVCHNLRIPRHKTFLGIAERGKGTMGWFYGFKLHLVTNYKGEIVDAKLTTGNVHDTKPVIELSRNLSGKLYADKGYISKKLTESLKDKGVDLITTVRRNMKAKALSLWDKAMLSRRFIIETINDQLKNVSQIEHSRHRSPNGFMLNLLGGLVAYCLKDSKPTLNITDIERNSMVMA
jgi:hypothetical protein